MSAENHLPDECEPLDAVSVWSSLPHGAAGDLEVALGTCADPSWIESRLPGVRALVCQMNVAVDPASVSADGVLVACQNNQYAGAIGLSLGEGAYCRDSELTVTFDPALPEQDCCVITLEGPTSIYGQPSVAELAVRTLVGDVNRDGSVSTADASSIKQRLGQAVEVGNAQYDVNADGWISTADKSSVKQRLGNIAPTCP